MLTVVAAVSHGRPVFASPPDRREEAAAARAQLCGGTAAVKSDHLAVVAAFNRWLAVRQGSGRQEAFRVGPQLGKQVCSCVAKGGGVLRQQAAMRFSVRASVLLQCLAQSRST